MKTIVDLRIATKILALLAMLSALCLAVALYGNSSLKATDASYSDLVNHRLPSTTMLARVNRLAVEMVHSGYKAVAYDGNSATGRETVRDESEAHDTAVKTLAEVKAMRPDLADKLDSVAATIEDIHRTVASAIALGVANRNDEANHVLIGADNGLDHLNGVLVPLNNAALDDATRRSSELTSSVASTARATLAISLIGILAALAFGAFASAATITRPLRRLEETMRSLADGNTRVDVAGSDRGDEVGAMAKAVLFFRDAAQAQETAAEAKRQADADQKRVVETVSDHLGLLAAGDLTRPIVADFPQGYVELRTNFNEAVDKLSELIGSVADSTASILTGSGEIAQASEDLARRTESNAASLEETAAAISQMDDRLKTSAEAAGRTVERADGAIATVSGGRAVADDAVQAMGRVSESAKGIDDVIEGLDKIAFQTRVLAMNAAVEAGRAGEAGRGFAVVADLVSALAMRAEEEAKRARDQLSVTQSEIVTAVEAVQKVDGALAGISEDVGQVHTLLGQMARDNQAQSSAVSQISAAVASMDQTTQQNAAMVEETSAAARNLSTEVSALGDQAARFRVDGAGAPARRRTGSIADRFAPGAAPARPLPAAAVPALVRDDDWKQF